jgi:hypothetical protein
MIDHRGYRSGITIWNGKERLAITFYIARGKVSSLFIAYFLLIIFSHLPASQQARFKSCGYAGFYFA